MSGPHVTIDPDPLEANDVDRAYAAGFADAWDATKPKAGRLDPLATVILIAAISALVLVAFAAGRASAAPRPAQTTAPLSGTTDHGDRQAAVALPPTAADAIRLEASTSAGPTSAPTDPPAIAGGLASYVGRSFGPRYLALPNGPGHRVRICGPAACVVRTSTDAGPDLAMQRAGRIADLSFADFGTVCGCAPATLGLVTVTVEDFTGPAQTPPATDVGP